jgi:hypothetical protein
MLHKRRACEPHGNETLQGIDFSEKIFSWPIALTDTAPRGAGGKAICDQHVG